MKRAVILHGTDGSPIELAWQAWLKAQLEASEYEVYFPQLPGCHKPNLKKYDMFLRNSAWNFSGNIIIGHSSGATTLLHLLQQDWFPRIRAAVLVGTFLNEKLLHQASWYKPGQFDDLFVEDFDVAKIQQKAEQFYFVHGDNDPYCDYDEAKSLCEELHGIFLTVHGGGHIASSAAIEKLPILTDRLQVDGLL